MALQDDLEARRRAAQRTAVGQARNLRRDELVRNFGQRMKVERSRAMVGRQPVASINLPPGALPAQQRQRNVQAGIGLQRMRAQERQRRTPRYLT